MPFAATWMNPEIITHYVKLVIERQIPYVITCMWNLKYDTNEHIYKQKETHKYRKQTCDCQDRGEGRKDWEFGISRYSIYQMYMVYTGGRNNKVLLYNPGNYIQHPVIN